MTILLSLLTAFALVALGLHLRARAAIRQGAARIHAETKAIFSGAHEYAVVAPVDFPHLDLAYYDATAAALEALGFARIGDLTDATLNEVGTLMPTMVRVLAGDGASVIAAIYHARVRSAPDPEGPGNFHIIDFETPFDDGSFVLTSNAPVAGAMDQPPQVDAEFLPPGTGAEELLVRHRARVQAYRAARAEVVAPLATRTPAEAIAHQQRLDEIKAAFRAGRPAIVSQEELRRLAPATADGADVAFRVGRELERLQQR